MESKNNASRMLSVLALLVAVVGVSIGFAAYSNTLTIKSSAEVTANEDYFDVNFSSSATSEVDGEVVATKTPATLEDLTGDVATIDNSDQPTITGLKANFTNPGQEVKYSFYAHNNGQLKAYLKAVSFANVEGNSFKKCTAKTGTTQAYVDAACSGINISLQAGSETFSGSKGSIKEHLLDMDAYEPVVVTITYAENSAVADGDFDVEFGDITLTYSSVD